MIVLLASSEIVNGNFLVLSMGAWLLPHKPQGLHASIHSTYNLKNLYISSYTSMHYPVMPKFSC